MYEKYKNLDKLVKNEVNYFIIFAFLGIVLVIMTFLEVNSFDIKNNFSYLKYAWVINVLAYSTSLYRSKDYREFPGWGTKIFKGMWLIFILPLGLIALRFIVYTILTELNNYGMEYKYYSAYKNLFRQTMSAFRHYMNAGIILTTMSPLTINEKQKLIIHPAFVEDHGERN